MTRHILLLSLFSVLTLPGMMGQHVRCPIVRGSLYEPLIDIRVTCAVRPSGINMPVQLSLRGDDRMQDGYFRLHLYNEPFFSFLPATAGLFGSSTSAQLTLGLAGIGRTSTVTSRELIVGESVGNFANRCLPDSLVSVPYTANLNSLLTVFASIQLGNVTIMPPHSLSISSDHILTIPTDVGEGWMSRVTDLEIGFENLADPRIIQNCTENTISRLAIITIQFPSIGMIQILPSDLFRIDPINHTCVPLFCYRDEHAWSFSPLHIPEVNIYLDRENLMICDALVGQ